MRFLFIVQGEGRGHMTQAIALASVLRENGHTITRVIVGRSSRRVIPEFFKESIQAPIDQVDSPNFVTDKNHKSVHLPRSIFHALRRLGMYRRSILQMDKMVKKDQPDVIINFFDFIGGLYSWLKKPDARVICIAHQYLTGHTAFEFPDGHFLDQKSMELGNWITALGADSRLALSFHELPDQPKIEVVPPLLREEVRTLQTSSGDHLLVYMLNHGYAEEVDRFHAEFPEVRVHCFWDKPDAPEKLEIDETLTYHQLNGELFLKYLASCRGLMTTAGYEAVCEAMYLGKPVLMMPVEGHYEQACNALDAEKAGAGIQSRTFDLELLLEYLPRHKMDPARFRSWCDRAEAIFLEKLINPARTL